LRRHLHRLFTLQKRNCRHVERGRREAISHSRRRFYSTGEVGEMINAMYLRHQAERLLALSRATIDLAIAGRLRGLAGEFLAKAEELEAEEDDDLSAFQPPRQRQSGGAMDRD